MGDLGCKKQYLYSLPQRPKLRRICQRTKITQRAPRARRRFWQSRTSNQKFWWFDYSRSQSSQRRLVNLETIVDMRSWCKNGSSRIRAKQKLLRKLKGACKSSLEPDRKPKIVYAGQFLGIWQGHCEDLSWNHCTSTPHRKETNGIADRAVRRVKEGTSGSTVAIRSGWKMVGRFHGMLFLSAKHHRSLVWWEDAPVKGVLENLLKGPSFRLVYYSVENQLEPISVVFGINQQIRIQISVVAKNYIFLKRFEFLVGVFKVQSHIPCGCPCACAVACVCTHTIPIRMLSSPWRFMMTCAKRCV